MTVFHFVQRHIDAIKHSMRNVESEKIYCLLYLLLEAKGKIFFTGVGKNGHVAAKAASTFINRFALFILIQLIVCMVIWV